MGMGSVRERNVRDKIEDAGEGVIRIGASGAGTDQDLPDILACIDGEYYCWELKYCGDRDSRMAVSYSQEETEALVRFSDRWHAQPELLARFAGDTSFYRRSVDEWLDMDTKTKSWAKEDRAGYPTLEELL